ncbi:MAG: PD-(D/E)XK nuclease family protein [Flavobacteriaceae bacterium]
MKSFLEESLDQIWDSSSSLEELTFVLPSQRACVFLKDLIIKKSDKAGFLPKIIPIEKFIEELSGLAQMDRVELLFNFYEVFLASNPQKSLSFDAFSNWATTALQDFNEIDRHLVDAKQLFSQLSDIKKMEEWKVDADPDKDYSLMRSHLFFMERLGLLYQELKSKLLDQGKGYQGLIYREAREQSEAFCAQQKPNSIFLLGFNALNKAEEHIFQDLLSEGKAQVFWDGDAHYMNNDHIAGHFLRKYRDHWPFYQQNPFPEFPNRFESRDKNLISIAAPKNISQVKYFGQWLSEQESIENTAVVLADENLLGLCLSSLPSEVKKLNITMGFPLRSIPMSSLFEALFHMYSNRKRLKLAPGVYYYKDVLGLFKHPDLQDLWEELEGDLADDLQQTLQTQNQLFLTLEELKELIPENLHEGLKPLQGFFVKEFETKAFLKQCLALIQDLKPFKQGIEKEFLFRFHTLFEQLKNLNESYEYLEGIQTIHDFYKQLLTDESLSFQGEPLQGLQLMGMLETRSLDFDRIVLLGSNEGILPSGKSDSSFIPFDVKLQYDLPTYLIKDGIYAYHFFRLIQRASKVIMTHNSETDGLGSGERSRFVTMLDQEDLLKVQKTIGPLIPSVEKKELVIEKSPEVIKRLQGFAKSGVSPSALNTYINNPPQFYFEKLLSVYEADKMEETMALNTLGTIIHDSLEELYKPYIGKQLTVEVVEGFLEIYISELEKQFLKSFKKGRYKRGKNFVTYQVAQTYISSFLKKELQELKEGNSIEIVSLEQKMECEVEVPGISYPIKLKGLADRIDRKNGELRIVDYKTGKVQSGDLYVGDLSELSTNSKRKYVLQVLFYAVLYMENNPHTNINELKSGIISFKNFKAGFMSCNYAKGRKRDDQMSMERYQEFKEALIALLYEIFNPEIPFKENEDKKYAWV